MKVAVTGGTGFIGGHLARALTAAGHKVVLISRGFDERNPDLRTLRNSTFFQTGLDDPILLSDAFSGCAAIAHCAGINRERGNQR